MTSFQESYLSLITEERLAFVIVLCESVSAGAAAFLLFCYCRYNNLRSFAFRLVCCLSASDFLRGVLVVVCYLLQISGKELISCSVQALIYKFTQLSAILWSSVIAYCLRISLMAASDKVAENEDVHSYLERKFTFYALSVYALTVLLTALPILAGKLPAEINKQYCWIAEYSELQVNLITLANFYLPVWAVCYYNIATFVWTKRYLRSLGVDKSSSENLTHRLRLYPMIIILCYVWASINIAFSLLYYPQHFLDLMHLLMTSLQGFFNALVYGLTRSVIAVACGDSINRCCCCSQGNAKNSVPQTAFEEVNDNRPPQSKLLPDASEAKELSDSDQRRWLSRDSIAQALALQAWQQHSCNYSSSRQSSISSNGNVEIELCTTIQI